MAVAEKERYERILSGKRIWHADGRSERPSHVHYRESFRATYQGPCSKGKLVPWDGLRGNRPGMVRNDPVLGFDLTMRRGEALAGSYTTRDIASAPHGVDYRPHFADWERDPDAHPNLVFPGRAALFTGVRFEALNLGDDLRGTGGCILQDWVDLDFATMERTGDRRGSISGGGITFFGRHSLIARTARLLRPFQSKEAPFARPLRPGVAPLYAIFARVRGYGLVRTVYVDPDVPHEIVLRWTRDASTIECWLDGRLVLAAREGARALPAGRATRGRVRLPRSGFHVCCWQDNADGSFEVNGLAGHPDRDQVFTVESMSILAE